MLTKAVKTIQQVQAYREKTGCSMTEATEYVFDLPFRVHLRFRLDISKRREA